MHISENPPEVSLTLTADMLTLFYPLLQQGVELPVTIGCSVMQLLNQQLGIAETYIADRITTLFLDGKAIDDPKSSFVQDGSTLALSSAMPGLVGSTMRRGGHLAAMRGEITYKQTRPVTIGAGKVKIKLFNLIMKEVGDLLLARGVYLALLDLTDFLTSEASKLENGFLNASFNGRPYPAPQLSKTLQPYDPKQLLLVNVDWRS